MSIPTNITPPAGYRVDRIESPQICIGEDSDGNGIFITDDKLVVTFVPVGTEVEHQEHKVATMESRQHKKVELAMGCWG